MRSILAWVAYAVTVVLAAAVAVAFAGALNADARPRITVGPVQYGPTWESLVDNRTDDRLKVRCRGEQAVPSEEPAFATFVDTFRLRAHGPRSRRVLYLGVSTYVDPEFIPERPTCVVVEVIR